MLEKFRDKKIYLISHCDLDGIGARIIFEHYFLPLTRSIIVYNSDDNDLPDFDWEIAKTADYVIFTDIYPPSIDFYKKITNYAECYIFDHHKTSKNLLGDIPNYYFDLNRCGTKLLYDFCKPKREKLVIKKFVDLINCYDLWDYKNPMFNKAHDFSNIMYGYVDWSTAHLKTETQKHENFIGVQKYKLRNYSTFQFTLSELDVAKTARRKEKENFLMAKRNMEKRVDNEGNNYIYFECQSKLSWVAHLILNESDKTDYVVGYATINTEPKVSLRSRTFDVEKIAIKWGGGGHEHSAGIKFENREDLKNFKNNMLHLN